MLHHIILSKVSLVYIYIFNVKIHRDSHYTKKYEVFFYRKLIIIRVLICYVNICQSNDIDQTNDIDVTPQIQNTSVTRHRMPKKFPRNR